jgi:hypothetical protein
VQIKKLDPARCKDFPVYHREWKEKFAFVDRDLTPEDCTEIAKYEPGEQ